MADVIKNYGDARTADREGSGVGLILGILIAIILIVLFFVYALPAIRNSSAPSSGGLNVNVDLPSGIDNSGGSGSGGNSGSGGGTSGGSN